MSYEICLSATYVFYDSCSGHHVPSAEMAQLTVLSVYHHRLLSCLIPLYCVRYSDWLRAARSGDRIPVVARFSPPVQTCPGVHPASHTMGTGSFPGVKRGRGVTLTPHPLLVPWSRKSRAIQ